MIRVIITRGIINNVLLKSKYSINITKGKCTRYISKVCAEIKSIDFEIIDRALNQALNEVLDKENNENTNDKIVICCKN